VPDLIKIDSPQDPRLSEYRGVREAELRKDRYDAPGGLFVAEGELVVRRLIASAYRCRSVLTTPVRLNTIRDALDRLEPDLPVYLVDQPTINGVVGFNIHRGILAIGLRGQPPSLESLLLPHRTLIILEDLTNHDNIGGIFRNTAALAGTGSAAAILLSPRCADPLYRKSIRVSVGQALTVPFATLRDWPGDLARIRAAGYRLLALTPSPDARDIADVASEIQSRPQPLALLLGSEGPGLSGIALGTADDLVRIPMPGQTFGPQSPAYPPHELVDSLNVSVAAGIAIHRLCPLHPI
jgi:tRNA G18 (ribose-2'-O)-methylase SpoU